jgi:hypothetical protein
MLKNGAAPATAVISVTLTSICITPKFNASRSRRVR